MRARVPDPHSPVGTHPPLGRGEGPGCGLSQGPPHGMDSFSFRVAPEGVEKTIQGQARLPSRREPRGSRVFPEGSFPTGWACCPGWARAPPSSPSLRSRGHCPTSRSSRGRRGGHPRDGCRTRARTSLPPLSRNIARGRFPSTFQENDIRAVSGRYPVWMATLFLTMVALCLEPEPEGSMKLSPKSQRTRPSPSSTEDAPSPPSQQGSPLKSSRSICLFSPADGALFVGDVPVIIKSSGGTYENAFIEKMGILGKKHQNHIFWPW